MEYVCGFCFSGPPVEHVILIKKLKPEWQRGLWNGVGGKVESGETIAQAMEREWTEETGTASPVWKHCVTQTFKATGTIVHFLRAFSTLDKMEQAVPGVEEEAVGLWRTAKILQSPEKLDQVNWLIPMLQTEEFIRVAQL